MRTVLRSVSTLLIPDQTGQRAIEEALGDWYQAQASAGNIGHRVLADAQGAVSLFRVLAMVTAAQLGHRNVWGPFAWAVAAAVVVSVASTLPILFSTQMPGSPGDIAILTILIMPAAVAVLYPIVAAIGLGVRRNHAMPLAGQIVLAAVFAVTLIGWIVPAANHAYVLRVLEILDPSGGAKRLVSGPAESSLPKVVAAWRSDRPESAAAARRLSATAALTIAGPTFLVLGVAVRRRWVPRGSWRLAQVTSGAAVVAAIVIGKFVAELIRAGNLRSLTSLAGGTELWLILIVAWLITALALRTKHQVLSTQ